MAKKNEPTTVDSYSVDADPHETRLTLNGETFSLAPQILLALRRDLDAAAVNTTY